MAKFISLSENKYTLAGAIEYICDGSKHAGLVTNFGGIKVDPLNPFVDMDITKRIAVERGGSQYKHYVISFKGNIAETNQIRYNSYRAPNPWAVVYDLAKGLSDFTGCQVLYAVHQNTNNFHIHFIVNSVRTDGSRLVLDREQFIEMLEMCNKILDARNLEPLTKLKGLAVNEEGVVMDEMNGNYKWWLDQN